jgi:hypothetical protein
MFLNSLLAFINTTICLLSDSWVLVKPIRILFINESIVLSENSFFNYLNIPPSLHKTKSFNCKPLNGIIEFGLFKGFWLLNYAFGCRKKHRAASSIYI